MAGDDRPHGEVCTRLGSSSTAPQVSVPSAEARQVAPGQLYTWGRGSNGQLGQNDVRYPPQNCAMPHPVRELSRVVQVACGGGQQGCTAAVSEDGALYTFGNNYKGRLGHGEGPHEALPRRVQALIGEHVLAAACGPEHSAALVRGGNVWLWGSNRHGELGRGFADPDGTRPASLPLPGPAVQVECEDGYSGALLADGQLFTWGDNTFGKLGQSSRTKSTSSPGKVALASPASSFSLGSLYAGACTVDGGLFMWGYGGHGNLGLGDRRSKATPAWCDVGEPVMQVACTRGQGGCKGGAAPSQGGQEGPHTVALAASGSVYTFGTCHKGLLGNLGSKTGAFGKPWDELRPYKLGGPLRNGTQVGPLSPFAVWPPPYDSIGPVVSLVSAHIHVAVVDAAGRAWAWGCGSNDGRCGVERFLNMAGEGKPPVVDAMKCYMMGPHRIGMARPQYWKHVSLEGQRVLLLASGRNHMAAVAVPQEAAEPEDLSAKAVAPTGGSLCDANSGDAESRMLEAFKTLDPDGSGTMDVGKFRSIFHGLNPSLNEEALEKMIAAAGASRDGRVDYEELLFWVCEETARG